MIAWRIHHKAETVSTNLDARDGVHGDVFTADYQTAGRGRLDHKWLAPPGANLAMSVVLGVGGRIGETGATGGMGATGGTGAGGLVEIPPEEIATLPLVIGLAVVQAISKGPVPSPAGVCPQSVGSVPSPARPFLKWPNDVLIGGRKVCGILCERHGDFVIAGIGVNVKPRKFPPELAETATSLGSVPGWDGGRTGSVPVSVSVVRDAVLKEIGELYEIWRTGGFKAVYPKIQAIDWLRGQALAVRQTDDDAEPVRGVCGGIQPDGSLLVGETPVYAGEAHVVEMSRRSR